MDQVSRPLLIALVAAVAFLGVWFVALRPHGSSSSSPAAAKPAAQAAAAPAPAPKPLTHPARVAVPAPVPRHTSTPKVTHRTRPVAHPAAPKLSPATRLSAVQLALAHGKVLALLFYNPAAADDQAVKQELGSILTHRGSVFKVTVPLAELANYSAITSQVPVNISPTLVIVDRAKQAQEIVGFADSFEIAQRISQALSA